MSYLLWTLLSIIIGLGVYLWSKVRKHANFWQELGVDVVGSEVIGSTFANIRASTLQYEADLRVYNHAKHGQKKPYIGMMEFFKPLFFVFDLDLARQIFIKDFDVFMDRQNFPLEGTDPMFAKMLIFKDGEEWKELRAKMSPTFTTGKIRRMFEIFSTCSTDLVKHLRSEVQGKGQVVDFRDAYERYSMAAIASAAFGVDAKTFEEGDSIFQKMGRKLQLEVSPLLMVKFLTMMLAPGLAKALHLRVFADQKCESFFTNVIKSAIRHRQETGEVRDDFLQLMLEARSGQLKAVEESELSAFEKEGGMKATDKGHGTLTLTELTDDVIVSQSVLFIFAGFDTTQTLLLFAAYELALNPDVQDQLRDEIEAALENSNGKFTYDAVNHLEYLDKVMNETLRKYPPVPRLERRTGAPYKIPGTDLIIPKDVVVGIPTYSVHFDPEHFPEPERFDPERFSNEVKSTRHPYAFQPFGHGPRNCIGMRFALTNAKMAIASIVHNFILEPSAETLIPMKFSKATSLKPESMLLKLTPRK